jgi:hypothetical protein
MDHRRTHLLISLAALVLAACAQEAVAVNEVDQGLTEELDYDTGTTTPNNHPPPALDDDDGDGILNIDEDASPCLDRYNRDTDNDGIPDGVELGGYQGFSFAAAGANPCHKDIFVELDYVEQTVGGVTQSAKFGPTLISKLKSYYAGLPVGNPDGTTGIKLHIYNSDALPATFSCANDQSTWSYPQDYFHKGQLCLASGSGYGGHGALPGNHFRITAQPPDNTTSNDLTEQAQYTWYFLFLHELGHNLGLHHGGDVDTNNKPNYPSVMNYSYDDSLAGSSKTLSGAGVGYSTGKYALDSLDECALKERNSFPHAAGDPMTFLSSFFTVTPKTGSAWVDWDGSGGTTTSTVRADINKDGAITCGSGFVDVDDTEIIAREMGWGLPG